MMNVEYAFKVLQAGGYFERKDERRSPRRCARWTTRLYSVDGQDLGVANYPRKRLMRLAKLQEVDGPNNEQRFILK